MNIIKILVQNDYIGVIFLIHDLCFVYYPGSLSILNTIHIIVWR